MNTRLETRVAVRELNKKGEIELNVYTEKAVDAMKADAEKKGEPSPDITNVQTFERPGIETLADAQAAGLSEERIGQLILRSWNIAETDAMRDTLTSPDFEPVPGAFNLLEICSQVTERRKASSLDKLQKALEKVAPGVTITPQEMVEMLGMIRNRNEPVPVA